MGAGLMGYLDEKARQVRLRRAREAPRGGEFERLRQRALNRKSAGSMKRTLSGGPHVALVAEFKRRSPSAGRLLDGENPVEVARLYERGGAAGLSVLTEDIDFGGGLGDLQAVASTVPIPALRKDFIIDVAALYEARAAGAAAALIIIRILSRHEAATLIERARDIGLECLVEVHDEAELDAALDAGATLIGINNRDLRKLTIDLGVTDRLAPRVPDGMTVVSESGIQNADDVRRVRDAGAHATLVGESLLRLRSEARAGLVADLSGVER
jgi:indole-3-glycerol phosphate synthase